MSDIREAINLAGYVMSEEEKEIVEMVHDFVMREVRPTAAEYDRKGELNWDAYNKAFEMGLICADLPAEYGGQGLSAVAGAWIREELMYGDAGFGLTCGTNNLGIKPVLLFGTPEQKEWCVQTMVTDKPGRDPRWPKKRSGFGAFALTEPEAGSDAANCRTTAVKSEDGSEYILNGRKCFITNACYADFFTVVAATDKSKGAKGLSMFLVDAHLPGIDTGHHEDKMGIRQSATCDIVLEDVHVPASALVGEEGMGFIYAMKTLEQGRASVGSGCVGIMRHAQEVAAVYAQQRVTMGKPICKHQLVAAKLADMEIAIQSSRAIGMKVAALIDAKDPAAATLGPVAKVFCSEQLQKVVYDCVQVLGGYGYMRDYEAEKLVRDARIFAIFEGTNEINRTVISRSVIKQYKI